MSGYDKVEKAKALIRENPESDDWGIKALGCLDQVCLSLQHVQIARRQLQTKGSGAGRGGRDSTPRNWGLILKLRKVKRAVNRVLAGLTNT